jgi:hypothetical protein
MIRNSDRKIAVTMVRLGLWTLFQPRDDLFGCARLRARWGTRWLWNWMRARQPADDAHHAPMCPANRWSGQELVIQPCLCGAHAQRRAALQSQERT